MRIWAVIFCATCIVLFSVRAGTALEPSVPLPVREGAHGAEVKKIQARLQELGFYSGRSDGVFGPVTVAAVKRFQTARSLPAVGFVGPSTYQGLFAAGPTSVSLPVREGARGAEVKKIQARLQDLNFYKGRVDGLFGPQTTAAVKRFQQARHLPAVGFVGPRTYREIFAQPSPPPVKPERETAKASVPPPQSGRKAAPRLPLPAPEPEAPGGRVALTFDDGPDPAVLPAILVYLERHDAKATFFVEGKKAAAHADLLRTMVRGGHEIENHTFSHRPFPGKPHGEVKREILETAAIVRRATGRGTQFVRPPGGAMDDVSVAAARATGHKVVLWTNVGAHDVPFPGRERLVADILASVRDGSVVMLHGDRPETAAALPELLTALRKKGFRMVRLDELMGG